MSRLLILMTGLLLSTHSLATPPIPAAFPDWLKEAMAQEAKVKPARRQVKLADKRIIFKPPAKLTAKPEQIDNYWYLTMDLKSSAPMECWIYNTPIDPAASTAGIAEEVVRIVADQHGGLNSKALFHTEISHLDAAPILSLYWLFTAGPADSAKASLAKVKTAVVNDVTFICSHADVGYMATFAKAFDALIKSAKVVRDQEPYYEAMYTVSVQGRTLGFTHISMSLDADGDTESYVYDAMLLPLDSQNLSSSDSATMSFSRPDGTLINQVTTTVENGNLTTNLSLEPVEGAWQVSGQFQGKELQTQIEYDQAILSDLGQLLVIKDMVDGKLETQATFPMWLTEVDPTVFTDTTVELSASGQEAKLSMAGLITDAKLNAASIMTEATMQAAGTEVNMQLVWEAGDPFAVDQ